jgi:predicted transcriptional regulator
VDYDSDVDLEAYNKPPIKVRVDSAQKRPAHVDKFVKELQTMEAMEKDFKKSALQLQKKLGINFNGMVA